jgi:putative ABC transport system ATP-binding protein
MTDRLVTLDGVTRRYGTGQTAVTAVDDLSLEVGRGDRIAVVGASGSGKSTLLSLLGLIERPDVGRVMFEAIDTAELSDDERANIRRTRIGLVFQLFHLVPALTALDNVLLPLIPYQPHTTIEPRATELLGAVGLADRLRHRPAELSGGEQQRVAIARALIAEPDLVLADEPTGNLDSATSADVVQLLITMQERHGYALVIATHDTAIAGSLEKRWRLEDGRVTASGKKRRREVSQDLGDLGP